MKKESDIFSINSRIHRQRRILDGISGIYDRMEDNPYQFPDSKDPYLLRRGYKEAYVPDMDYKMVFRIDGNDVYVVGLFHDLEDYVPKVTE